jgi:hypothetical protein
MQLPFSVEDFLGVFRDYNAAIGIAPFVLLSLAVAMVALAQSRFTWRHRAITAGLGLLWLWAGAVYHWEFFAQINPVAKLFGALFGLQAVILFASAARNRLRFVPRAWGAGWALIVYGLVAYPVLGFLSGHGYPNGPSFGAPCPVTIFFCGMMFWVQQRPLAVLAIPLAWTAVGTSAALQLGIREDLGLAVAGLLLTIDAMRRRSTAATPATR